jgi:hypothetical protein
MIIKFNSKESQPKPLNAMRDSFSSEKTPIPAFLKLMMRWRGWLG